MNNNQLVERALDHLRVATGLNGKWKAAPLKAKDRGVDGQLILKIDRHDLNLGAEIKRELRTYQLQPLFELAKKHPPFIVIAERIFPRLKEEMREKRINYLDGAGNIFLAIGQTYLFVDGRQPEGKEVKTVTNRAFTKAGLKVVFHLLLHDNAINLPYRQIAEATGVALGNINNVVEGLRTAGFILQIDKRKMKLQNKQALLERWIAGYKETLKPALHKGNFKIWKEEGLRVWQDVPLDYKETVWGGEPAAEILTNYLLPGILTIYTKDQKNNIVKDLRLIPDENGKVEVYEKFWKDIEPTKYAPPLLVYADLLITDDPRCIETAEMIYNNYLKNEFE